MSVQKSNSGSGGGNGGLFGNPRFAMEPENGTGGGESTSSGAESTSGDAFDSLDADPSAELEQVLAAEDAQETPAEGAEPEVETQEASEDETPAEKLKKTEPEKTPRADKRIQQLVLQTKQAKQEAQQVREQFRSTVERQNAQTRQLQETLQQSQVQMAAMAKELELLHRDRSSREVEELSPIERLKREQMQTVEERLEAAISERDARWEAEFQRRDQLQAEAAKKAAAIERMRGYKQQVQDVVAEQIATFDDTFKRQTGAAMEHFVMNWATAWNKPMPDAARDLHRFALRYTNAYLKSLKQTNGAKMQASQNAPKVKLPTNGKKSKSNGFDEGAYAAARKNGFRGSPIDFLDRTGN